MSSKNRNNSYFVKKLSHKLVSKDKSKRGKDFIPTKEFIRGLKLSFRQGKNISKLYSVINQIRYGETLRESNFDHQITGSKKNQKARECHIEPNWLFLYRISEDKNQLILIGLDVGSHNDTGMTENES